MSAHITQEEMTELLSGHPGPARWIATCKRAPNAAKSLSA